MNSKSEPSRPDGHLCELAHAALWWAALVLAVTILTISIAFLHDLPRSGGRLDQLAAAFGLALAGLASLVVYWRRYWFRPADLRRVVLMHGGTEFHERSSLYGIQIKARVGTCWLLATLNRPVLDFLPASAWPAYEFSRKLTLAVMDFMREGARVGLVQLGDFSRFPQVNVVVRSGASTAVGPSGDATLDRAIEVAARALADSDFALRVEVRPQWMQVEVDGGAWLGGRFSRRIELLFDFSR